MKTAGLADMYSDKPATYFGNARKDIAAILPTDGKARVLELGCGSGGTGRFVKAAGKAFHYTGIELNAGAAERARLVLDEVLIGDVQTMHFENMAGQFDALIMSEVLEHLIDPWTIVSRLVRCLKPGGYVVASSPNLAQWRILLNLARGSFHYEDSGTMDRTHLRWFTPRSFRTLFEEAGVEVASLEPITHRGKLSSLITHVSGGRLDHLFMTQMMVTGWRREHG